MINSFTVPILVSAQSIMDFHTMDGQTTDDIAYAIKNTNLFQDATISVLPKLYDLNDLDDINQLSSDYLFINTYDFNPHDLKINPKFSVDNDTQFWPTDKSCLQIKFIVFTASQSIGNEVAIEIPDTIGNDLDGALNQINQIVLNYLNSFYQVATITAMIPEKLSSSKQVGNDIFHEFSFTTTLKGYLGYYKLNYSDIYLIVAPFSLDKENVDSCKIFVVFKDMALFFYQRNFFDYESYDSILKSMTQLFKFLNIDNVQVSYQVNNSDDQILSLISLGEANISH